MLENRLFEKVLLDRVKLQQTFQVLSEIRLVERKHMELNVEAHQPCFCNLHSVKTVVLIPVSKTLYVL